MVGAGHEDPFLMGEHGPEPYQKEDAGPFLLGLFILLWYASRPLLLQVPYLLYGIELERPYPRRS